MTASQRWRKASYSSNQTACVELPRTLDAVRDSKNGVVLRVGARGVAGLLAEVKRAQ